MPRSKRADEAGAIYQALNRGNARSTIFHQDEDYRAFLETLAEAHQRFGLEIHAYCFMDNH